MLPPLSRLAGSWAPLALILGFGILTRIARLDAPPIPIFDESLFYLPAARSYLQGLPDPNFEHPPLGKEAIAAGMALFGDNPWGWRVLSALTGAAGIGLTYQLARALWSSREVALLAAALLSLDFLWLNFSRLAMLDIFLATLVLAALLGAWTFRTTRRLTPLLVAAAALGLATGVKWSGAWALLPIAFTLLPDLALPANRKPALLPPLLFLLVAFLGYAAPWLYHALALGYGPQEFVALHQQMLGYQVQVGADRLPTEERLLAPLSWLLGSPLVFTSRDDRSFWVLVTSNPLLLLPGLLAVLWLLRRGVAAPRSPELFLAVAFLALYLPWFVLPRIKYFYYLLPAMPLLVIALAGAYAQLWLASERFVGRKRVWTRWLVVAGLALTAALFVAAYPALTGYWRGG